MPSALSAPAVASSALPEQAGIAECGQVVEQRDGRRSYHVRWRPRYAMLVSCWNLAPEAKSAGSPRMLWRCRLRAVSTSGFPLIESS